MYNISELSAMNDDQLKNVAESMGLKKFNPDHKEDLIYQILDEQAISMASNSAAEKKKRGPKPKKQQAVDKQPAEPADSAQQPAPAPVALADNDVAPQPKKRGRKPKNQQQGQQQGQQQPQVQPAETPQAVETVTPRAVAVETSPADASQAPEQPQPDKPRRGRRPRADKERQQFAQPQDADQSQPQVSQETSDEQVLSTDDNRSDTPVETQPQASAPVESADTPQPLEERPVSHNGTFFPRNQQNHNQSTPSLGSFFPRGEGRRFLPRSQREKEAAAMAAATAPIIIQEPLADRQEPKQPQQQGKKGKKNRNQPRQILPPEPVFNFDGIIEASGVLEIMPEGYGFLRSSDYNYLASPDDVYVTQQQIKAYGLKAGDVVECSIRPPKEGEKYFPMCQARMVNGRSPEFIRDRVPFEHLTPLFPDEKFDLTSGRACNISTRVVDMFSPIGKGQRGLIVAPPKTGKTILLKDIANAIAENHPKIGRAHV